MRRLAACVALSVGLVAPMSGEPMKAGDRQRLLAHLEMTESWLVSELSGLSPAQLTYRMTPESWSITDVTEHLAIAEPQYWQRVNDSMKQPATTDKIEATDAGILWYGIDRTNRQKTGEARVPHGTFKSAAEALAAFRKLQINDARVRAVDERRPQVAQAPRRQHGRLSVVPDDLDALAATHPADSRGQGARRLSEGVEGREETARTADDRQQGRKVPASKRCELGRHSGPEETRTALA